MPPFFPLLATKKTRKLWHWRFSQGTKLIFSSSQNCGLCGGRLDFPSSKWSRLRDELCGWIWGWTAVLWPLGWDIGRWMGNGWERSKFHDQKYVDIYIYLGHMMTAFVGWFHACPCKWPQGITGSSSHPCGSCLDHLRHVMSHRHVMFSMDITPVFLFPPCQVRVVRFYLSCLLLLLLSSSSRRPPPLVVLLLSLSSSSRCPPRPPAQLRLAIHSVRCRTSTTTIHAQCSLPDLNHDHPRPVFPAGPQPRVSTPSVPCRTSTTTIHAQCSLPDLNREYPRQVFPAGPHVGRYGTKNVQKKVRKNVRKNVRRYARRYAR